MDEAVFFSQISKNLNVGRYSVEALSDQVAFCHEFSSWADIRTIKGSVWEAHNGKLFRPLAKKFGYRINQEYQKIKKFY